jgi:alginate O-acetyltransferase complex protein AlgI
LPFNSYSYLLLLAVVVAIFWALTPRLRRVFVLLISVAIYASWSVRYVPLLFLLCTGVFLCGQRIALKPELSRRWLWSGIAFTLSILGFFKYRQFAVDNLNQILLLLGHSPVKALVAIGLPLGISFYSFEAIGYLIDTSQGRAKKVSFMDLTLFLSFWPNLISGPLVRVRELLPQLSFRKRFDTAMLIRGLDRLIWGLVQKNLIANSLGAFVGEGFLPQAARINTTLDNWFLAFAFGLQIYFDFASYSNMAIGTAQLIGVTLPENFRFPYHAANPAEFWARWHMTLSRWIRDYLFFPLNAKFRAASGPLYASLIGIMALVGLWHGAGWGFVLWGLMHGIYLAAFRMWERFGERRFPGIVTSRAVRAAWQVITILAVMAAWIPFRAGSVDQALAMLSTMVFRHSFHVSYSINLYLVTLLAALLTVLEPYAAARFRAWETRVIRTPALYATNLFLLRPLVYGLGLLLFVAFDDRNTQFIYFQF